MRTPPPSFMVPKRGITTHCRTLEDFNRAVGLNLARAGIGLQMFKTVQAFMVLAPHLQPNEEGTTVQFTQTKLYLLWTPTTGGYPVEVYWPLEMIRAEYERAWAATTNPSGCEERSILEGSIIREK